MKKSLLIFLIFPVILGGCNGKQNKMNEKQARADSSFSQLAREYLSGYFGWRPEYAVALGLHQYDGRMSDLSQPSIDKELERLKKFKHRLEETDTASLSDDMRYDFNILKSSVDLSVFNFEEIRDFWINPMIYAGGLDMNMYIKRNFAPLEDRLKSIISVEKKAPDLFAAARANLADSLAKPYVETAILIARGSVSFLQEDLVTALKEVKNDSLMAEFNKVNKIAVAELKNYIDWLEKEKLPRSHDHYAIGREKYVKMLLYGEAISLTPEKILELGLEELGHEKKVFDETARKINPGKNPADVYEDMKKNHPTSESLISDVKRNAETIRQFLIDKKIVTVPAETRALVTETPKYGRSVSTASMDSPGEFETKATEAYFYVTPVDASWTEGQKEDWLKMFDYYTTDLITIHEVYPGHYIQFLHLNSSSATPVEKVFGSYAYVEGWAHYAEKMMIDEKYGDNGDSVEYARYRLAQSAESLLRLCRLCVSIKMHCQGMTLDEATRFFMDNWHQGEKPSYQEALRGTYDPGYLYYALGKMEMLKLRSDYEQQEGGDFSLLKFHDQVLDHGMPPIRFLREKLLKDNTIWGDIL
jgi:uncharacterized protein (DUF885 family)